MYGKSLQMPFGDWAWSCALSPQLLKCNTLCKNTQSPDGFRGGGIFHKSLSSETRGGIRISVFA